MPAFDDGVVKDLIRRRKISSISIDANVFHKSGYGLEHREFKSLSQFKRTNINIVIPEVVLREVRSHMVEGAQESINKFKVALRAVGGACGIPRAVRDEVELLVCGGKDVEILIDERISIFSDHVSLGVLSANSAAVANNVIDRYFNISAPFGKGEKKSEFPDALALEVLSEYADINDTMILMVSDDKGWKDFASQSKNLFCVSDLRTALAYFQDLPEVVSASLLDRIVAGRFDSIRNKISDSIKDFVDNMELVADAESRFFIESNISDQYVDKILNFDDMKLVLIEEDDGSYVFSGEINVSVRVKCDFRFYIRESGDREAMEIGSRSESVVEVMKFSVFFEIVGDPRVSAMFKGVEVFCPEYIVFFGIVDPAPDGAD